MAINFNVAPYYDDFNEDNDYLRILFRPGYAVQARELTQLQTILQKQVSRFGDHIFKNGSLVVPGSVNVDNRVHFAKLDNVYLTQTVRNYLPQFVNKIVTGVESGVKALVIDTSECECVVDNIDIPTLYFKVETPGGDEGTVKRFIPGETIVAYAVDNTVANNYRLVTDQTSDLFVNVKSFGDNGVSATTYANNSVSDVLGYAFAVEVEAGVYYIDGYFVKNQEMHLYVGRFTTTPSFRVGFQVTESIVTPEEEPTLADNSQGSTNYAAPGAHRYKISVSLVKLPLDSTDDIRFIELLRVVQGRVQNKIEKASYAELEKTLARRTYDQSGDYEVNKFKLNAREHLNTNGDGVYPPTPTDSVIVADQIYGDEDKFVVAVDPGKAYIQGFEVEVTATQFIPFNKARENTITGDEGGHIIREEDYPVATPIGNFVTVNNVYGYPNISTFQTVYLYDVPRKISNGTTVTTTYADGTPPPIGDKIGTARVKAFQLNSGSYATDATEFKLGLFDIQMDIEPTSGNRYDFSKYVKSIAGATTGTTAFTCDIVGERYQLLGAGTVTSGSPNVAGIGTLFTEQVKDGDMLYVDGTPVGVVTTPLATGVPSNIALVMAANYVGTTRTGVLSIFRAPIQDARYDSLVFQSAFKTLKTLRGQDADGNDTVKSSVQTVRRIFANITTNATTGEWSTTLASPSEFFQSAQDLSNYTLFAASTNTFVNLTSSNITLDASLQTVTISASLTPNASYTLITSILQRGVPAGEKTKSLQLNQTATFTGRKVVNEAIVTLPHADVLRIVDIRVNPGNYDAYSTANSVSILDKYVFDDGQRVSHYQAASISLLPNVSPPSGAIQITYDYFEHTGSGNYFSVDSYAGAIANANNNFTYGSIPSFPVRGTDGKTTTVYLHDVLDYRPVISGTNTFTPELPKIGEDFNTSIAYYLPRIDKLIIDSTGRFVVIQGIPALQPKDPQDPKEGMVLATVAIPAFTKSFRDIRIFGRDNRRYTMRDIAGLEKRISNLEYYVSLTLLEQETSTLAIKDGVTGLDRFKNGFIVDQFTGHGVGDVKNIDYRIAVDSAKGELRPMHFTDNLDIVEDVTSSDERFSKSYQKTGDIITVPYTTSLTVFNPYGTRTIDVNPYKVAAFKGEITLVPEGDNWKDTDRRPDLVVTDDNNFDAIRFMADTLGVTGTQWGAWQTQWTGSSSSTSNSERTSGWVTTGFATTTTVDTGVTSRTGIQTSLQSSVNRIDYGDRVVDISFAEFMRARPVTFLAQNLKPMTKFYAFFDDEAVTSVCQQADVFKLTRASGATFMRFDLESVRNLVVATDSARTYQSQAEPAFQIGDVITNSAHTPATIQTLTHIDATANPLGLPSFSLTLNSVTGLGVGHHVQIYNMGAGALSNIISYDPRTRQQLTVINRSLLTSRQLNNRIFKISAISGTTVTLVSLDGKNIAPFDSYNKLAYRGTDGGKLFRLRASGVVVADGLVDSFDTNGVSPLVQDMHVVNIKNGFSIGESVTGNVTFTGSTRNRATITGINGNTTTGTLPVMTTLGAGIRADAAGNAFGVFYLPNNDTMKFRTGEKDFKLTDNISNSDADFDSQGTITYFSTGVTLSKERTIVNSRTANFVRDRVYEAIPARRVSTSTRVLYQIDRTPAPPRRGHDPIAQTFTISALGGAFVTHVDLYFSEAGLRPVTVELRNTNLDVPSTKIVPFSVTTKLPSQILTSVDGSVATRFTFQAPIYLQDNESYALVVKTDEPGCQIFVSEVGQEDVVTGNSVTAQPLTGSLYLSQNSKEFEINPLLDLKFRLYKADFVTDTVAQVQFKTQPPKSVTLLDNPFEISPNNDIIRVHHRRHGFTAGDTVLIENVQVFTNVDTQELKYYGTGSSSYGIPADVLNGAHEVLADGIDLDSFCIRIQTQDEYIDADGVSDPNVLLTGADGLEAASVAAGLALLIKGNYGGSGVRASRQLFVDALYLKADAISPTDTKVDWTIQAMSQDGSLTGYQPLSQNTDYSFGARKIIRSYENEEILSNSGDIVVKKPSVTAIAKLITANPNVSPVIDLQKLSMFAIQNLVNNATEATTNIVGIDDRTVLQAGNVLATDIDAVAGPGTISSYFLTNVFGAFTSTTKSYDMSATTSGAFTLTWTAGSSAWKWDGTGSSQTSTPFQRIQVGDLLYTDTTVAGTVGTNTNVIGIVTAVTPTVLTIQKNNGSVTGTATTWGTALTNQTLQFLVISKYVYGTTAAAFATNAPVGSYINNSTGTLIGEVATLSTPNPAMAGFVQLELTGAAQAANANASWSVSTPVAKLTMSNVNGVGVISTNIDTADNLLGIVKSGKYLYLSGMPSAINDKKYLITDVVVSTDTTVNVGNEERDKITITLGQAFAFPTGITSYTLDLINNYVYLQGSGRLAAGTGASTGTDVVLGNGSTKFTTEFAAGDIITLRASGGDSFAANTPTGNFIGYVRSVTSNTELRLGNSTLTTAANSAITAADVNYYIRKPVPNFRIAQMDKFVEDWAPVGSSNYANYITRPLVLSNPADSIKILFDSNRPQSTDIKVFYKAWTGNVDLNTLEYVDSGFTLASVDPVDAFNEREINIVDITPFTSMIIKIVMKSSNPANVPKVKNLRIITHS